MVDTVIPDITVKQKPTTLNDMINTHDSVGGVVYWSTLEPEIVRVSTRTDRDSIHAEVIEIPIRRWEAIIKGKEILDDIDSMKGNIESSELGEAIGFCPQFADFEHDFDPLYADVKDNCDNEFKAKSFVSESWLSKTVIKYSEDVIEEDDDLTP